MWRRYYKLDLGEMMRRIEFQEDEHEHEGETEKNKFARPWQTDAE